MQDIFSRNDQRRQDARARGAASVASSWIAELISREGIESDIPGRQPADDDWVLRRVADEFQAAERGVALESGGIMDDCGAMQGREPGAFEEDEDFIGDRVEELKKAAEASGYGHREGGASEIAHQGRLPPFSGSSKPAPNQTRSGDSKEVAGPPAAEPNKRGGH